MTLQRIPSQMWTSYLRERVEAEGFHFREPQFEQEGRVASVYYETEITPETFLILTRHIQGGNLSQAQEVFAMGNYRELSDVLRRKQVFEEWAYLVGTHGEGSFTVFHFDQSDQARVDLLSTRTAPREPLDKYESGKMYWGTPVIDDIIAYILSEQRRSMQ